MKDYDFVKLKNWMLFLDELDNHSNYIPFLAAYYYSNTQNISDIKYVVEYIESHYDRSPTDKWWWMAQAVMLSAYKLNDDALSLRLAFKLSSTPSIIPAWAKEMPAIIYSKMGENQLAVKLMRDILDSNSFYKESDLRYIRDFIKARSM